MKYKQHEKNIKGEEAGDVAKKKHFLLKMISSSSNIETWLKFHLGFKRIAA